MMMNLKIGRTPRIRTSRRLSVFSFYLLCWPTSNLRIRLVDLGWTDRREHLSTYSSDKGVFFGKRYLNSAMYLIELLGQPRIGMAEF
jgi:hypothetical protein